MFDRLKSLLGIRPTPNGDSDPADSIDCQQMVANIRRRERDEIPVGRKIYDLQFGQFDVTLDREFSGHYRISVFQDHHKIYGFTINDKEISDENFVKVWEIVTKFLGKNPSPKHLPDHQLMKSHFFGYPK